jgi:hypothetical protein
LIRVRRDTAVAWAGGVAPAASVAGWKLVGRGISTIVVSCGRNGRDLMAAKMQYPS